MIKVNSKVKLNLPKLNNLSKAAVTALEQTAEALHTDVVQAQVMPFDDPRVEEYKVYGKRGQFAKNGREYKGKTVTRKIQIGGTLQNESTFVNLSESDTGKVSIVSSTPYARRLYFHPEYNFDKGENPNARGEWFDDWLTGRKKNFAANTYKEIFRRLTNI